jgi:hypothetical protein
MKKTTLALIICCTISKGLLSQGCSDAGFCTLGNLNPLHKKTSGSRLTVGFQNGLGDESVYVFTPSIKYDYSFNKSWQVQAKITANYANGNLGAVTGLGDIFLNTTYTFNSKSNWTSSVLLGTKIPLNSSNLKVNGKSLPMQYQSSLGTLDAILGYTITNNKWLFATALQQPLTGYNNNNFLPIYFPGTVASKYPPTNDFNRKGDVLLRANYEVKHTKTNNYNLGVLAIYHLGNDTYIDGSISNNPIEIKGSDGLTLNLTASANIKVNKKISLGFLAGVPVVVRNLRPDGLTRSFSINTDLIFNF